MQFSLLTISALATSAFAIGPVSQPASLAALVSILETALPSSLLAEAATNTAEFASMVSSEVLNSMAPSWFSALPSNVQTELVPAITTAASATASTGLAGTNGTMIGMNGTAISVRSSALASLSRAASSAAAASTTAGGSSSGSSASSSSSGSGAVPTAAIGMSLAGLVGMVGVLAL